MVKYHILETHRSVREAYFNISQRLPMDDIKVKQRLDRAYDIVIGNGYTVEPLSTDLHEFDIYRESTSLFEDNAVHYYVDEQSCECPDFGSARGGLCKHRLAVMLVKEMCRVSE
jgi:SWIM zinc finger